MRPAAATPDVIAVLSDTHRTDGRGLAGRAREAVAAADRVLHAGDFTTPAVLDDFRALDARLDAVHGNADEPAVRDRLPAARTVDATGVRIALAHRRRGGETGLVMFGRERGADLVVSGHTHRPRLREGDGPAAPTLLDPGSHADPRGGPATHAELRPEGDGLAVTIRRRDGSVVSSVVVRA